MVKKALLGQVSDTELRLLRIFRAVVDCGGLAAAELELNIGRSTISRHLQDLEQRLGLVLCRRGRGGFTLTPEGRRVDQGARRLLAALEAFRFDVHDLHEELVGTLALGLFDKTATNPASRIPQAFHEFTRLAPQVRLEVTVTTSNEIETGVIDGRLDLGVIPDHRRSDSLEYTELFDERMILYAGQGHPLFEGETGGADLRCFPLAGLSFHSPNMEATRRLGLQRQASVSDQEAVAVLVLSGAYLGFLPDHYAAPFEQAGRIRRVGGPELAYDVRFVAIVRRAPPPSRIAATFVAALAAAQGRSATG